jgi:hypothetical protein
MNSKAVSLRAAVKGEDQKRGLRGSGGGEGEGEGDAGDGERSGEVGKGRLFVIKWACCGLQLYVQCK